MRDTWPMWLVGGVLAALVGLFVWQEIAHPCVRSEEYACSRTYCSTPMHVNGRRECLSWTTVPDTCSRCLERAP